MSQLNYKASHVIINLLANIVFAGIMFLSSLIEGVNSVLILGVRIIFTSIFILFMSVSLNGYDKLLDHIKKLIISPKAILVTILAAIIYAYQMWLFVWAPHNGEALPVSVGYLITPLFTALVGKLIFKEHITITNKIALLIASIGILSNIVLTGNFNLFTVSIFVTYPLLFALRKLVNIDHLESMVIEMGLLIPIGIYILSTYSFTDINNMSNTFYIYFILILIGLFSGLGWALYIISIRELPFNIWGLIGFSEVMIIVGIGFLVGETIKPEEFFLYICLGFVIILIVSKYSYDIVKDSNKKRIKRRIRKQRKFRNKNRHHK